MVGLFCSGILYKRRGTDRLKESNDGPQETRHQCHR